MNELLFHSKRNHRILDWEGLQGLHRHGHHLRHGNGLCVRHVDHAVVFAEIDDVLLRDSGRKRSGRFATAVDAAVNAAVAATIAATRVVVARGRRIWLNVEAAPFALRTAVPHSGIVAAASDILGHTCIQESVVSILRGVDLVAEENIAGDEDGEKQRIKHPSQNHVNETAGMQAMQIALAPPVVENGPHQMLQQLDREQK